MRRLLRLVAVLVGLIALAVTLHAAASYPSATKSFTTKLAGAVIASSHINEIQDEIVAIENGLRTGLAHNLLPDANNTRDLGASGTKWANVYTTALNVNGATLQGPVIQTTTSTGTVNDFALTTGANVLRCNNATALTITGFSAGTDGQRLIVASIGAGQVDISHQAAGSSVANRAINFATSGVTSAAAGVGWFEYVYDLTTARWRLVSHEQGAWITRTFAAGNYTGSAGTFTVASATTDAFWLKGRTLTFAVAVTGATSTVPGSQYRVAIPNSYVATKAMYWGAQVTDNGNQVGGLTEVTATSTFMSFYRFDLANFTAGAANVAIRGSSTFEVQ